MPPILVLPRPTGLLGWLLLLQVYVVDEPRASPSRNPHASHTITVHSLTYDTTTHTACAHRP